MIFLYRRAFKKFVKKQTRAFQLVIEDETETIKSSPDIGEAKKGDLSGFRVYKFKFQRQEYLIAYKVQSDNMVFYMIGTHENFYRELKQYIKEVE
ncbi:MAG: type II toxin-antitoxin system RelE/ParE family toxin [Nitrospirae bacterium]|nr:type II toxin-antitoxin system RelE/ParE family toxin [Nitrospirota bacterium]